MFKKKKKKNDWLPIQKKIIKYIVVFAIVVIIIGLSLSIASFYKKI